jgi:hypothetical protein
MDLSSVIWFNKPEHDPYVVHYNHAQALRVEATPKITLFNCIYFEWEKRNILNAVSIPVL